MAARARPARRILHVQPAAGRVIQIPESYYGALYEGPLSPLINFANGAGLGSAALQEKLCED